MAILKQVSIYALFTFLVISCNSDKYEYNNNLFDAIVITDWQKEKSIYNIELMFNKKNDTIILEFQDFKVFRDTINKSVFLEPLKKQKFIKDFSMDLSINDSLKYNFKNVKIIKDTTYRTFTLSRHYYIFNKIIADVNGEKIDNKVHIILPYKLGKVKSR